MVVYLLTCKTCEAQYVGSTKNVFRYRLNNYKSKFRLYYRRRNEGTITQFEPIKQASLFEHFISHENVKGFTGTKKNEDWSFWSFQLIDSCPDEHVLLQRESFWQYELDTFIPHGLNQRDVPFV